MQLLHEPKGNADSMRAEERKAVPMKWSSEQIAFTPAVSVRERELDHLSLCQPAPPRSRGDRWFSLSLTEKVGASAP
jgi:hypothetical protein